MHSPFESLDYIYVPAPDFEAAVRFYTDVAGGELCWKIHDGRLVSSAADLESADASDERRRVAVDAGAFNVDAGADGRTGRHFARRIEAKDPHIGETSLVTVTVAKHTRGLLSQSTPGPYITVRGSRHITVRGRTGLSLYMTVVRL